MAIRPIELILNNLISNLDKEKNWVKVNDNIFSLHISSHGEVSSNISIIKIISISEEMTSSATSYHLKIDGIEITRDYFSKNDNQNLVAELFGKLEHKFVTELNDQKEEAINKLFNILQIPTDDQIK